jgi:hypothetical protein
MTPAVLILLGVVLCFLGTFSLRVAVLVAGFGVGWLLANTFGASAVTELVVAASAAAVAFVVSLFVSKFVMFGAGVCVGAVLGARLFVLADAGSVDGHGNWLLAVVFVPAVALVCGFLGAHYQHRFLAWGTAAAGAALIFSGIGRIGHDADELFHPETALGVALVAVLWVALTLVGHRVQQRGRRSGRRERAPA